MNNVGTLTEQELVKLESQISEVYFSAPLEGKKENTVGHIMLKAFATIRKLQRQVQDLEFDIKDLLNADDATYALKDTEVLV